jgi:hypothetical protein
LQICMDVGIGWGFDGFGEIYALGQFEHSCRKSACFFAGASNSCPIELEGDNLQSVSSEVTIRKSSIYTCAMFHSKLLNYQRVIPLYPNKPPTIFQ